MKNIGIMIVALAIVFSACGGSKEPPAQGWPKKENPMAETGNHAVPENVLLSERFKNSLTPGVEYRAVVELEKGGEFEIVFFPEYAPNHTANFVSLARKGFYDGLVFHRVIEGFMAQGGDPTGTGAGGPGYTVDAEFSPLPHQRGTLSMARKPDPNSAGSQFFICFKEAAFLDGQYTVFGQVVRGMEVADGLKRRDPERDYATKGDAIRKVTIIEKVVAEPAAKPSVSSGPEPTQATPVAPARRASRKGRKRGRR